MQVLTSVAELSLVLDGARAAGRRVGLVPTMGALHLGHRSLIVRAAAERDVVAVTIFVNPLQFAEAWDLEHYPRTLPADLEMCREAGAAVVFVPDVAEMYPDWPSTPATTVSVREVGDRWEGSSRPGHFDGVATVVAKLFAMAGRCHAYFGEKDFQQVAVVRRLAADLSFPVEVVACPTVREADGLALSSRNSLLSEAQRRAAPVLARALAEGSTAMAAGERRPRSVAEVMAAVVSEEPEAVLDYAAVVGPADLREPPELAPGHPWRLLVAVRFGSVRLIDNCEARLGPVDGSASTADRPRCARPASSPRPLSGVAPAGAAP